MTTELWVPRGLAERLVVGARVQVRLTGECEARFATICPFCGVEDQSWTHEASMHGRVGTIAEITDANHPYWIVFDKPVSSRKTACGHVSGVRSCDFAAAELIPLDEVQA